MGTIFEIPEGRKKLHTWEKIAIVLHVEVTFDCELKQSDQHLEQARNAMQSQLFPWECVEAWQCAADWANEGKSDKDKARRGSIIAPRFLLVNDSKLAEHFARRKKITPETIEKIAEPIVLRARRKLDQKAAKQGSLEEWEVNAEVTRAEDKVEKRLRRRFRQRINFLRKDLWRAICGRLKNDAFY